jgi:predicted phosphatase
MSRKAISDSDGQVLAQMLYTNNTLRKLELDGNLLGPKSAAEFGKALKVNKSLKLLDLESNQLTVDG